MNKYDKLWKHIRDSNSHSLTMTFTDIQDICGTPLTHGFLKYKKDLAAYGFEVERIFLKEQKVIFKRID